MVAEVLTTVAVVPSQVTVRQVVELVSYLRQKFAPDKPPWKDVLAAVHKARRASYD